MRASRASAAVATCVAPGRLSACSSAPPFNSTVATDAYRERELGIDLAEFDERLVEVLDRLRGVFVCLVADIADAALGKEFDVSDGEFGKVLAHGVVGERRR